MTATDTAFAFSSSSPLHPTSAKQEEQFEEQVLNLLLLMIGECTDAFERLPLVENVEILRNILYSGVWVRYGKTKTAHAEQKEKHKPQPRRKGETTTADGSI